MKKFIIILVFSLISKASYAGNNSLSMYDLQVMKRNKASCSRLGNIYDACQWMLKFSIENNSSKSLNSFCSIIKINKKKYEICSSKALNKNPLETNQTKMILINLAELIKYKNDDREPTVRLIQLKGNFSDDTL